MKHFTKQKKMSNNGILSTDGAIRRWFSLLPLMMLMMWLVPTGLRAQVYDNSVTCTALDASWWSYSGQESDKLFDGKSHKTTSLNGTLSFLLLRMLYLKRVKQAYL